MDFILSLGWLTPLLILIIGLAAGVFGGMLGVGGSIIIIPFLTLLLGPDQHLYQAAAMIANIAVAIPASMRHYQAGSMIPALLVWFIPAAISCVLIGVWVSNLPVFEGQSGGIWLGRILSIFLLYVVIINIIALFKKNQAVDHALPPQTLDTPDFAKPDPRKVHRGKAVSIGGLMGTMAGLLGVGGGVIAVPLQQTLLKLPLRTCIANSSAIMIASSFFGAIYKNATLPQQGHAIYAGVILSLLLLPTAIIGGRLGAGLNYLLPLNVVRVFFVGLMLVATWRMLAIGQ